MLSVNSSFARVIDNNNILEKSDALLGGINFQEACTQNENTERCETKDYNILIEKTHVDEAVIKFDNYEDGVKYYFFSKTVQYDYERVNRLLQQKQRATDL